MHETYFPTHAARQAALLALQRVDPKATPIFKSGTKTPYGLMIPDNTHVTDLHSWGAGFTAGYEETTLTPSSEALFKRLAQDAGNWNGSPLWGGNVGGSKAEDGNLTDLKRKGLLETVGDTNPSSSWPKDEEGQPLVWVQFTAQGRALAATHGFTIEE